MRPLVVDLDRTLIKTDLLAETASEFLIRRPLHLVRLLFWLVHGRSELKARLARAVPLDASLLPYNRPLLAWLRAEKAQGRTLVLATAAHRDLAEQVARHLKIFDRVMASEAGTNLKGQAKCDALVRLFGHKGFEYVGNDHSDLVVWHAAAQAHVVSATTGLPDRVRTHANLGRVIDPETTSRWAALLKAMRPHQWLKNVLVFVPLCAAHLYGSLSSALYVLLAFVALGLAASSVYLLNDLADVAADRRHASKRHRPFAAGDLSLKHGWIAWPLLSAASVGIAILLPSEFAGTLLVYILSSTMYSLWFKRVAVLDVLVLAGLYTLRIIAGAAAIDVPISFWLLSFSMFMFLSLAFVKRYAELKAARNAQLQDALHGRGYGPGDLELVAVLGTGAGQLAVLVLALYIQDAHTAAMYSEPRFIWLACPILLYWISRAWMLAHRGQMHQDPILFSLRDRVSWVVAGLLAVVFLLAKTAW